MTRKAMVSGCFDMLHSGHVGFLQRAVIQGDHWIVALGAEQTVLDLKNWIAVAVVVDKPIEDGIRVTVQRVLLKIDMTPNPYCY